MESNNFYSTLSSKVLSLAPSIGEREATALLQILGYDEYGELSVDLTRGIYPDNLFLKKRVAMIELGNHSCQKDLGFDAIDQILVDDLEFRHKIFDIYKKEITPIRDIV